MNTIIKSNKLTSTYTQNLHTATTDSKPTTIFSLNIHQLFLNVYR